MLTACEAMVGRTFSYRKNLRDVFFYGEGGRRKFFVYTAFRPSQAQFVLRRTTGTETFAGGTKKSSRC